ncbi:MAG TPA: hypothetical protein VFA03_15615 [Acetobacteraceae bacterium]|nr:hypothetical protein [Acetobacteraceae bacterium]
MMSRPKSCLVLVAALGSAMMLSTASQAQVATTLEQAEVAGLSPEMRAEVQSRMKQGGQTVSEILTTILLNNIKLKHLGSQIMAIDFNRGLAVVKTANGEIAMVPFNTTTLEIKT